MAPVRRLAPVPALDVRDLLRAEVTARRGIASAARLDDAARTSADPGRRRQAERRAVEARRAALRGRVAFLLPAGPERDDLLARLDSWAVSLGDARAVDALIASLAYTDPEGAAA